jgi:hypothetical protein
MVNCNAILDEDVLNTKKALGQLKTKLCREIIDT